MSTNKTIKIKPEQSIVVYESFYERDCFGGEWDHNIKIFNSDKEAIDFIAKIKDDWRYSNIYGPLKQL